VQNCLAIEFVFTNPATWGRRLSYGLLARTTEFMLSARSVAGPSAVDAAPEVDLGKKEKMPRV